MIVIRTVLHAQFGKAGEVAAEMSRLTKEINRELGASGRWRILTDLSGPFDTVVQEVEVPSLADWELARPALFRTRAFKESFARIQPLLVDGRNEFWHVEAAGQ